MLNTKVPIPQLRLDAEELQALTYAVAPVRGEVFLFGSRTDVTKRGGDIDLLVLSSEDAYRLSQDIRVRFWSLCDEKLDVVVMKPTPSERTAEEAAFLALITPVLIHYSSPTPPTLS